MKVLSIDIETFSSVNLQKCGVYKYAESEDFEILLFGYAVDGGAVQVVDLACGESIPAEIIDALTISGRQKNDESNKWLSVRGTELFYLDFKDLGAVIDNNWDIFKDYFPSQSFILPKLNDMAECRNKIAHNSYIDDLERNLMKTYYNVILRQISDSTDK